MGAGFLSVIGGQVNKKLMLKAEKHEKIKVLADSKLLFTITDSLSYEIKQKTFMRILLMILKANLIQVSLTQITQQLIR